MNDEPHVGFVDAHAEGDRRADHPLLVTQEQLLMLRAFGGGQASVVGPGLNAVRAQALGEALGRFARLAINDAALPWARPDEIEHLLVGLVLGKHAIRQVRPVKAGDVAARLPQSKHGDDVLAHALGGGRRQCHHRNAREQPRQPGELPVFGAKIVAPLADAMRLVDRQQINFPMLQVGEKAGEHQPLGRGVKQPVFAAVESPQPRSCFARRQ
ncbi:MAG TPA: hypothetical protein VNZ64_05375 [Candidatus Acidoferrum sp.]|jgi:hypothetical protein|nr:hypothetical protein [Candidatus Acidoferrum sp.]